MPSSLKEWSEALNILAGVDPECGPEPIRPGHEEISIFVDPSEVSEEDVEKLEELGVYPEEGGRPSRFYVFTS